MTLQLIIENESVKRGHLEEIVLETLLKSKLYKILDYSRTSETDQILQDLRAKIDPKNQITL